MSSPLSPSRSRGALGNLVAILKSPLVKYLYFLALFGIAVYYLLGWGEEFSRSLSQARLELVFLAWLLSLMSGLLYSYISHLIYQGLGVGLPFFRIFRIMALSQLGKYVPGKVVFAGNYFLLSRAEGVGLGDMGVSLLISVSLMILTGILSGFPALFLLSPALRWVAILFPLVLLVFIHPKVFSFFLSTLGRWAAPLLGAQGVPEREPLRGKMYVLPFLIYLLAWLLTGLQLYLIASAWGPFDWRQLPIFIAAGSLAITLGFLVLFAPVGLGVREGVGVIILGGIMDGARAAMIMVVFRVVAILVDLTLGAASLVLAHFWGGRSAGGDKG